MPQITHIQLIDCFARLKGTRMLTLTLCTEPRLRKPKTNPLAGRVVKFQTINGAVGYDYGAAVNRQREKDRQEDKDGAPPDFQALARRNMVHVGGALLQHDKTGTYYVFLRPLSKGNPVYYVDGQVVNKSDIEEHLYFPPARQNGGRQVVSKEVPYINVKLTNIVYVKGLKKDTVHTVIPKVEPTTIKPEKKYV